MTDVYFLQDQIKRYIEKECWGFEAVYWPNFKDYTVVKTVQKKWLGIFPYSEEVSEVLIPKESIKWEETTATIQSLLWGTRSAIVYVFFFMGKGKRIVLFR